MIRVLALIAALTAHSTSAHAAAEVIEVTSPGGITAWLVEEPGIPILTFEMDFRGGPAVDPEDKLGATNLMMGLLSEGAGSLDGLAFTKRRQELAARFGFSAGRDGVSVSATMLTEYRNESLALLATALTQPTFPEDAIERDRARLLSSIQSEETDPGTIASRAFAAAAFPDHPYSRPRTGTVETVTGLTRADILAAHRRALTRDGLTLGVVGDVTADELRPILDQLFSGLPETGPPSPEKRQALEAEETIVIPFEGPQSVVRFGHGGIDRADPDFIAAFVVNHILGAGGYSSRLIEEVRVKRGLTYGVSSWLSTAQYGPLFAGGVSSANASVAEAIDVIRAEWARMDEEGVTAQELEDAKRFLTGAYALRFDGNGRIANILAGMQLAGQPIDYIAERNGLIEALTLEEVNRVAARILRPEALRFVVVGKP
ncbi:MAG: pitrilysin family protein, partial [Pseudomonadota bacterium]